jgi:hypothetical protein
MKEFIVITKKSLLLSAMLLMVAPGNPLLAQQNQTDASSAKSEGKIKIVKVIDGKTTVEEYDAGEMEGEMIRIEYNEDGSGSSQNTRVIRINGGENEEVIEIRESGEAPHMIFIDEEKVAGDGGEEHMISIEKIVTGEEGSDGKMQVHTIKVINGDTVLNDVREGQAGTMKWEMKDGEHQDGAHIMIMQMDGEGDKDIEKDVKVIVDKLGKDGVDFQYEVIIERECKSVKMEEPASSEIEKIGGQDVEALEVTRLEAFPSPNEGRFTLRFELQDKSPAQLRIFNLEGQQIFEQEFSGQKKYEKQIDLGDVPAGVYLLRLIQGESSFTRKLVVE